MNSTGHDRDSTVTAVLGPTNTGKTHYAIERMLGYRTGVIGLPLRLLAREVYDRLVALRGPSVVALVTGEERLVPQRTQYWVCTVEAMPLEIGADFVAVDEIQLCADTERGHVFTERLLNARGLQETLFLGSSSVRSRIADLIPKARFMHRERFSKLTWAGSKKLSRLPPRAAIVAFSVEAVYAMAELMRRRRGGAAVVLGALSPRTRNAQVALYQNGEVDYMIATDAIGMGLNLDVRHVAFAGLRKFDGRRTRDLWPEELAQIAGRAGRYEQDGTFGVTGEAGALSEETIASIENHRFGPIRQLQFRNSALSFGSVEALIDSLEQPPPFENLVRTQESDDLVALRTLSEDPTVRDRLCDARDVRRIWDVCQIPDFRKTSPAEHSTLLARIYQFLSDKSGCIPSDWFVAQLRRIDRTDGDIDTLSRRLAYIRTWTYVTQRRGWVENEAEWREETRAVEDRLSDALHAGLTQRFVDRRTSVLMRRMKQRESLVAQVSETGEVTVEDQFVGRLEGFRFSPDESATGDEARTLQAAGTQALQMEFNLRADRFYNAPDTEIGLTEQGGLMWGEYAVGKLVKGADVLSPQVTPFVDDIAGVPVAEKVTRRLQHWIDRRIAAQFEPLKAMRDDETITGLARGVSFQLDQALGVIPRDQIADDIKALDQDARALLRKHGVRFGQYTVFQQALLKPAPTQLRLVLLSLFDQLEMFPEAPPAGLVTIPAVTTNDASYYPRAGYRLAGERAIRIDMLERLADLIRGQDTRKGFEANADMLSITGMTLVQFSSLMAGLGYKVETKERIPEVVVADANADPEANPEQAGSGDAATPEEQTADPAAPESTRDTSAESEETSPNEPQTAAEDATAETKDGTPTAVEATQAPELSGGDATKSETPEPETYFVFTWAPPRRDRGGERRNTRQPAKDAKNANGAERKRSEDKPKGKFKGKPRDKDGRKPRPKDNGPRVFTAKPPRKEKAIDPDNPFAALRALTEKE